MAGIPVTASTAVAPLAAWTVLKPRSPVAAIVPVWDVLRGLVTNKNFPLQWRKSQTKILVKVHPRDTAASLPLDH